MYRIILFLVFFLNATSPVYTGQRMVAIKDNGGGSLDAFEQQLGTFKKDSSTTAITGECMSACTIFMTVPNACATKDAHFFFHAARFGEVVAPLETDQMAKKYNTPKAYEIQKKYGSFSMMFTSASHDPVKLEKGVYRVSLDGEENGKPVIYEMIRAKADMLIPKCR